MEDLEGIVKEHQDGTLLNISVTPNSDSVVFPSGLNKWRKSLEIKVSSPAKDNRANKDIIKTIADFFEKPMRDVFVVSGSKNKNKTILIKGVTTKYVSLRVRDSLDGL